MSDSEFLASDFKTTPYWWEVLPSNPRPLADVPSTADVVIIGAGLTGTAAAATLARAGRQVVIFEKERVGFGASARNAGFIGRHFKHSLRDLVKRFDKPKALSYFIELRRVFDFTIDVIKGEALDCALQENGRFVAAMSDSDYQRLTTEYQLRRDLMNEDYELMPDGGASEYLSARVAGGLLLKGQAAIHPGLYAQAMARRAEKAGATLIDQTGVTAMSATASGFRVTTERGAIDCRNVLVATNGYGGSEMGWLRRRLIPIRGYIVTTEPLSQEVIRSALPHNRTYTDNRLASNYLRWTPDGSRIMFGGQTGAPEENDPQTVGLRVRKELVALLPQLEGVKLSHAWTGRCAASVDMFPKIGCKDGVHFALGYCFSGNALGPYLGHQAALRIMGQGERLAFEADRFTALPFFNGNPWFLPYVQTYYEWMDRLRR